MSGIQFGNQLDLNGFKATEVGPGTAGTDAVNLNQLNALAPQGFAQNVGDGVAVSFTITHNFNTLDVVAAVVEISTGNYVFTDSRVASVNTVIVAFGSAPTTDQYRVLIVPVP